MDDRLQRLDRRAERILSGLAPLRAERAERPEDLDVTHRLRAEAAQERGWARARDLPDGRERDADDEGAIVLVCRDGDAIVGCMRLVPPAPGRLLPTERDLGVRVRPVGSAAEGGRLVVAPAQRGARSPLILAALLGRFWLEVRELGLRRSLAAVSADTLALYRALGLEVAELDPARVVWGEERIPVEVIASERSLDFAAPAGAPREDAAERAYTRRRLLVGGAAAVAAAGGVMVVGVTELMAQGPGPRPVGTGRTDQRSIGLIARLDQVGRRLTAVGRLTRVQGVPLTALATGPPGTDSNDPAATDLAAARLCPGAGPTWRRPPRSPRAARSRPSPVASRTTWRSTAPTTPAWPSAPT